MRDHFLVGKLVTIGALDHPIQHKDCAKGLSLDDGNVLRLKKWHFIH